ncbi:MAG TPA: xanthine dehydrogenase family protein subunit M [Woeseiaceae bacterium]|nr:xanthine dehydrogenase family protein subunit M [Woeseiaceae bacterium]
MYDFEYHRAGSVDEAAERLGANSEAKLLAGGMTLLPTMKLRLAQPDVLVDLGGVEALRGVSGSDPVVIGATTTHAEVAASAEVGDHIPALAALAAGIGDAQVRNRGTIGGSLANSDPAADYPAAVLGLGATIGTNRRRIPAEQYFRGMFETALEADEIIVSVSFPKPARAGYAKFANPASRYAVVGVFVADTSEGLRVAVTGAGPCVFRVAEMEAALSRDFSPDALAGIEVPADELNEDLHASAEYRAHLIGVMARRAVAAARG